MFDLAFFKRIGVGFCIGMFQRQSAVSKLFGNFCFKQCGKDEKIFTI